MVTRMSWERSVSVSESSWPGTCQYEDVLDEESAIGKAYHLSGETRVHLVSTEREYCRRVVRMW
jgi:hypothetical protein